MKNENGFVLPLMIAITFVVAYLLLMLATQLEVKVASYERTRSQMVMESLEREGVARLESFLSIAELNNNFSDTWILRNGAEMILSVRKREDFFEISYKIRYNGYFHSRNLSFCFNEGIMFSG